MNFNKELFLENTRNIHLINTNTIPDYEVREKLNTFVDYEGNPRISTALGEICTNVVGRTMFKILMSTLPPGQKIRITNIGPMEALNPLIKQNGSSYLNYELEINLNLYDRFGIGVPERQYYCLDKDDITIKRKSIAGSIFHEFTHCLHHVEDRERYNSYVEVKLSGLWSNKEELRTIAGYVDADAYVSTDTCDPICDNCYCLYGAPRIERYYPRLGHIGFIQGTSPDKSLEDFCDNPTFNLAWPMKYIVI
jgi:hypothetical protein